MSPKGGICKSCPHRIWDDSDGSQRWWIQVGVDKCQSIGTKSHLGASESFPSPFENIYANKLWNV
jgi:hypothetical protein